MYYATFCKYRTDIKGFIMGIVTCALYKPRKTDFDVYCLGEKGDSGYFSLIILSLLLLQKQHFKDTMTSFLAVNHYDIVNTVKPRSLLKGLTWKNTASPTHHEGDPPRAAGTHAAVIMLQTPLNTKSGDPASFPLSSCVRESFGDIVMGNAAISDVFCL